MYEIGAGAGAGTNGATGAIRACIEAKAFANNNVSQCG